MKKIFLLLFTFSVSGIAQQVTINKQNIITRPNEQISYYPQEFIIDTLNTFQPIISNIENIVNVDSTEFLKNIRTSISPEQVLITKDNKYAFVYCYGNSVDLIDIENKVKEKSFDIPIPQYMSFSNSGEKLFVISFVETNVDTNLIDLCFTMFFWGNHSILTVIDVESKTIEKQIIIDEAGALKILCSDDENNVFVLTDFSIYKVNVQSSSVQSIYNGIQMYDFTIDNKNDKLFICGLDSLIVLDINSYQVQYVPYNFNGHRISEFVLFDSLYNRLIIEHYGAGGALVYNSNTLEIIDTLEYVGGIWSFLVIPEKNKLLLNCVTWIVPNSYWPRILEFKYSSLEFEDVLPLDRACTMVEDKENDILYVLQEGVNLGHFISSSNSFYLDITQYNFDTNEITEYRTSDSSYYCSHGRTVEITSDYKYVVATNSPENTVSILDLSLINEVAGDFKIEIDNYSLTQNYPNPFNPSTVISYRLPVSSLVTLKVYDILGREVATLVNEEKSAGVYEVEFDGSNLTSGVYFYRMKAGAFSDTKKFILMK